MFQSKYCIGCCAKHTIRLVVGDQKMAQRMKDYANLWHF